MSATGGDRNPRRRVAGVSLVVAGWALVSVAALTIGQGPAPPEPAMKPEYARVIALEGTVGGQRIDGVHRTVFQTRDSRWSAVLLPNQILAALENEVLGVPRPRLVTVTGVVTEYRGRNYLLLRAAEVGGELPPGG